MYTSDEDYFKSLIEKPSVFKNTDCLSVNYIPSYLPHREEELRILAKYFKNIVFEHNKDTRRVIITGSTGSGKTTLAKKFGQMLSNIIKSNNFHFIYLNCRIYKRPYLIFSILTRQLDKAIPPRGYSFEELQFLLIELLKYYKPKMLIVLDEIDYLVSRAGADILYTLLRIGEMTNSQYLSFIFIAKNTKFLKLLDSSTQSSFQSNHLSLEKYSETDLIDIVRSRAEIAFYEGTVTNDAIRLIADIASKLGDARYAIELLWGAGHCCDNENSPVVYPNHVRKAKSLIHPEMRKEVIIALTLHQKLVLLAILRKLKYTKNAYISTNEVISAYKLLCEEYSEQPRKHTQFWSYLQELAKQDIITTKLSGRGMKGKTTLISIPDTPLETIEGVLVTNLARQREGERKQKRESVKNGYH
ncbi:MAG: ORC1-type DNA replication protein [Candidatus Heimdallarchaeaceae archaeon]